MKRSLQNRISSVLDKDDESDLLFEESDDFSSS